jgi:hypothetical protein
MDAESDGTYSATVSSQLAAPLQAKAGAYDDDAALPARRLGLRRHAGLEPPRR